METSLKKVVADNLRAARMDAGYERESAAAALKIDTRTLGHYETGRSEPKFELLGIMSKLYSKPIAFFFGESSSEVSPEELSDTLIDKIIYDLLDEEDLPEDFTFEDLDLHSQQILLGALNKHMNKIRDNKKRP